MKRDAGGAIHTTSTLRQLALPLAALPFLYIMCGQYILNAEFPSGNGGLAVLRALESVPLM
jgi:hypothetical protein